MLCLRVRIITGMLDRTVVSSDPLLMLCVPTLARDAMLVLGAMSWRFFVLWTVDALAMHNSFRRNTLLCFVGARVMIPDDCCIVYCVACECPGMICMRASVRRAWIKRGFRPQAIRRRESCEQLGLAPDHSAQETPAAGF